MYEHDFGIGTHIALMIAEDVSRRRSWADGHKNKTNVSSTEKRRSLMDTIRNAFDIKIDG